jgi:hypothetical protein
MREKNAPMCLSSLCRKLSTQLTVHRRRGGLKGAHQTTFRMPLYYSFFYSCHSYAIFLRVSSMTPHSSPCTRRVTTQKSKRRKQVDALRGECPSSPLPQSKLRPKDKRQHVSKCLERKTYISGLISLLIIKHPSPIRISSRHLLDESICHSLTLE